MNEIYAVANAIGTVAFVWGSGETEDGMAAQAASVGAQVLASEITIVQRCSTTLGFSTAVPDGKTADDYEVYEGAIREIP